jgi:hypothetical protein
MAGAASMNWYFTDGNTSIPSGAEYWMDRTTGNGSSDLAYSSNDAYIWVSDEAATTSSDMSGTWTVDVNLSVKQGGAKVSIEVGELSGGTFTSRGMQASTGNISVGSNPFDITTTSHTIASGDYIAIRIICTTKSFTVDLTGTTDSPSYASSPTGAADFPGDSEVISFTVTDYNSDGIDFGSLAYGVTDQPADQTGGQGTLTLVVGAETNVATNIQLRGDNFSGSATFLMSNADVPYDDDQTLDEGSETGKAQATLSTSYTTWYSVNASTSSTVECYNWITIPSGQEAGSYTSTFYYQAIAQ